MIQINCLECFRQFETKDKRTKYCSRKCANDARRDKDAWQDKECPTCGDLIKVVNRADKYRKFCNNSCAAKYTNSQRSAVPEETKQKISSSLRKFNAEQDETISKKRIIRKDCRSFQKRCDFCGENYTTNREKSKFCSNKCSGLFHRKPKKLKNKNCLECGKLIQVLPKKNKEVKFCSISCASKFYGKNRKLSEETKQRISESLLRHHGRDIDESKNKKCEYCQKIFNPDKKIRKYCSNECRILGQGRSIENKISYRTWMKVVKRAFPDWVCPLCAEDNILWDGGIWNADYDIHHIHPKKTGGSEDTSNLIILCPNHHRLADRGKISEERLSQYSIGKYFSNTEILEKYYYGYNRKVRSRIKNSSSRNEAEIDFNETRASSRIAEPDCNLSVRRNRRTGGN